MCQNLSVDIALFYPSGLLLFPAPPGWLKTRRWHLSLQLVIIPASSGDVHLPWEPPNYEIEPTLDNLHLGCILIWLFGFYSALTRNLTTTC